MTVAAPFVREPAVDSKYLKGSLPEQPLDNHVDFQAVAVKCVASLDHLQSKHLTDDAFWKDNICMTGTFRTIYSSEAIVTAWTELTAKRSPRNFSITANTSHPVSLGPGIAWITCSFTFDIKEVPSCKCSGILSIVPDGQGSYKIWCISTVLEELHGFSNPDIPPQPQDRPFGDRLDCLIVGGGAAGLGAGARLQSLGLSYVIVDKNTNIGDSWAQRYDSAKLHLSKSFSELPYHREFSEKPYFLTKDDLAEGYQNFADRWQLNVWMSTSLDSAEWHAEEKDWLVHYNRHGEPGTIKAKHLVMATGGGVDVPTMPNLPGRDRFSGIVVHSSQYKNPNAFKGKKGIVVGCANTGFDIAGDMVDASLASITMIQRGKTAVYPASDINSLLDIFYNDQADLAIADRIVFGGPYPVGRQMFMANATAKQTEDPGRYDGLRASGFNFFEDKDLLRCPLERLGGHYLDMGNTKLVAEGKVKIKTGFEPVEYTSNGLRLANGDEVEADLIVFATGFRSSMRQSTAELVGQEVADRLQDFWGLDAEGELRGLAKPIGHPAIWYLGGGTVTARFHSRFLALQIQAAIEGMPFEPYTRKF
ncbi:FAD/NAD(P)-binding domain-containing protein [Myriangium duriaei CBS 260.36]|uniref:FAD/NAD(P)-binding domain-containing protein n=1 Tax=Myriangium duriaei CBS 260.36 TaxID=1168546 RepID=A0A9P4MKY7_9PEZI|nr:FAD/NAD(P)-binding domain-containing protein [Myriangium duriaei CBS 260.36]